MVTLVCFITYLSGCTTGRFIPPEEIQKNPKKHYTILAVMTTDSTFYEFRNWPKKVKIADDRVTGILKDGTAKSIPLADVETIKIKTTGTGEILLWTGAGVAFVIILAVIISSMDFGVGVHTTVEGG